MTWAPFASGRTALRGSVGIFYDWLATGTYEESLRVDGVRQQELNILDPSFPDPGNSGFVPPINRYVLGTAYSAPRITRVSAGVDQGAHQADSRGRHLQLSAWFEAIPGYQHQRAGERQHRPRLHAVDRPRRQRRRRLQRSAGRHRTQHRACERTEDRQSIGGVSVCVGRRQTALPPGIGVFGGGGAAEVRTFDQGNARYRLQLFVQGQNLTNQANYVGYSGTLTSPFFGRPTTVLSMRKVDAGISMQF
jgi:hypothetical protein